MSGVDAGPAQEVTGKMEGIANQGVGSVEGQEGLPQNWRQVGKSWGMARH